MYNFLMTIFATLRVSGYAICKMSKNEKDYHWMGDIGPDSYYIIKRDKYGYRSGIEKAIYKCIRCGKEFHIANEPFTI